MSEQQLIDAVVNQISNDVKSNDFTAIEEILAQFLNKKFEPHKILKDYLTEI